MDKTTFFSRFHCQTARHSEPDYPLRHSARQAAVMMTLFGEDELEMLFTVRASHLRHHGGQISFPGGGREPADSDLLATALRECEEEIALPASHITPVGQLSPYKTISGFEVTPFIGWTAQLPALSADPSEVESIFSVPLAHLIDPANQHVHWVNRHGRDFPIYFIPWTDKLIWGATAAFIRNLSHVLRV